MATWTKAQHALALAALSDYLVSKRVDPGRLTALIEALRQPAEEAPHFNKNWGMARRRVEADEFADIWAYYPNKAETSPAFWRRLLKGPVDITQEAESDYRNRQFEIWFTSFLSSYGVPATWCQDQQNRPDVEFRFEGNLYWVSAKRPASIASLRNCITNASRDLARDLKHAPSAIGLVALSLDRVFLEHSTPDRILGGHIESIRHIVYNYWLHVLAELGECLLVRDSRVAGVFVTLKIPFIEKIPGQDDRLSIATQAYIDVLPDHRRRNSVVYGSELQRLAESLASQMDLVKYK